MRNKKEDKLQIKIILCHHFELIHTNSTEITDERDD